VKVHLLTQARYFLCTASSAAKVGSRAQKDLESHLPPIPNRKHEQLAGACDDDAFNSDDDATDCDDGVIHLHDAEDQKAMLRKVARKHGCDVNDLTAAQMVKMPKKLLTFKHVVLDEAGAMLQPDMVGTIIHGCRFLLFVGDHRQVPIKPYWLHCIATCPAWDQLSARFILCKLLLSSAFLTGPEPHCIQQLVCKCCVWLLAAAQVRK
jgi:hypothetical protein